MFDSSDCSNESICSNSFSGVPQARVMDSILGWLVSWDTLSHLPSQAGSRQEECRSTGEGVGAGLRRSELVSKYA